MFGLLLQVIIAMTMLISTLGFRKAIPRLAQLGGARALSYSGGGSGYAPRPVAAGGGSSWGRPNDNYGRDNNRYSNNRPSYNNRGSPKMHSDPFAKLNFRKTVKIDPSQQTPVADLTLSSITRSVLEEKGFTVLTPVQSQSYEHVFEGGDVVARSRTGTGKTFAFGLPLIEKVVSQGLHEGRRDGQPLVLILEPTRELCQQVATELSAVCRKHRMRVEAIYGGVSVGMQERALRDGVHFLVATPGRLLDHISRGTVDLSAVRHVVLDEGDTMLEMGFQQDVESILMSVKSPGAAARKAASKYPSPCPLPPLPL